ncbi:MAG: hypothetical protein HY795_13830 [Desulfovibrio sp.]|jgi:hypothetical protein|nr:hypothetical protein [Desulfovibrio sp.]MBI4958385.1 hypothetical protein [Desulfovibrio sp.]
MKKRTLLYAVCAFTVLAGLCASVFPVQAQEGARGDVSGHVTMRVGRGALLISATGGDGELTFEGQSHKFKLGGMGIGLVGFTTVDAEGDVFNLKKIEDFAGAYVQGGADYAAGDGQGVLWLKNTKGVVMKLRSKTKGVSLAVGGEGLLVQMGNLKK